MKVKYIGTADYRVIRTSDMERRGITGFKTTTWARAEVQDVPDNAGKWLVDKLPDEFKQVEDPVVVATRSVAPTSTKKAS